MSRMKSHFIIVCLLIISGFIGCESGIEPSKKTSDPILNPTDTLDSNPSDTFQVVILNGFIEEYSHLGTFPSINTQISYFVNDTPTLIKTDKNGKFSASFNRDEDSLRIKITKNSFSNIDTLILLDSNIIQDTLILNLNFRLNYLLSYFPLKIDDVWSYDVSKASFGEQEIGIEDWKLLEIGLDNSFIIYEISYYKDKRIEHPNPDNNFTSDTTFYGTYGIDTIRVNISKDGNLSCSVYNLDFPLLDNCLRLINNGAACTYNFSEIFRMYHPYTGNDTLLVSSDPNHPCSDIGDILTYELIKDKGIKSISVSLYATMGYMSCSYKLRE